MLHWLEYESGHAWCESAYKYQTMAWVAEFANTVSNVPIIVLPLVNLCAMRLYIHRVNWEVAVPHLLLTFNGFASAYYHATLNLFGQLVDELSLLWLIKMCLVVFLPIMHSLPAQHKASVPGLRLSLIIAATLVSGLCFLRPDMNAFALMASSIPGLFILYHEGIRAEQVEARRFSWQVIVLWLMATVCWFADRLLCPVWLHFGVPYLHAVFHVLSSVAAYILFVMLSLLDVERRSNEHRFRAVVRYFPGGNFPSLPYIALVERHPHAQ